MTFTIEYVYWNDFCLKNKITLSFKTGFIGIWREDDEILGNYIVDLDFPTLILARSEFLTIVDLIDLTFIGNYSITEIKEQIKKDSLCYLPIIYSLLDNYLAIDFNHSKSK